MGKHLSFLDSDDSLDKMLFERLTALKAHNVDAIIGEYDLIDVEGNEVGQGLFSDDVNSCVISQNDFGC